MASQAVSSSGANPVLATPLQSGADSKTHVEAQVAEVATKALSRKSDSPTSVIEKPAATPKTLEQWIDTFFAKAATIKEFRDGLGDLHDHHQIDDYEELLETAQARLSDIEECLKEEGLGKAKKSKLKRQYKDWHKKFNQYDFLVDLHNRVVTCNCDRQSCDRIEKRMLPELLNETIELDSVHHTLLADLCALYLKHDQVKPDQAYRVLLGLPESKGKESSKRLGELLRWGAQHLAWNGHYEHAARLFHRSRDHVSGDSSRGLVLGASIRLTFMHSGKILGCSTKESALAAIARMKKVLIDPKYKLGFKVAVEGSVHVMGMLHDNAESDEDGEGVELVSVTEQERANVEEFFAMADLD